MRHSWRLRFVICLGLAFPLVTLWASPAAAQFYVRSPDVEKGVLELEEHGALYSGQNEDERRQQSHEVEARYGFTDRWAGIVNGYFQQNIGEDLEAILVKLGAQYEFVKREGDGLALAFRSHYEFALKSDWDQIEFGPLGEYVWGSDSARINAFFIGEVGDHRDIGSLRFKFDWRLKHELNERWGIGVEGYSRILDLSNPGTWNEQDHRLGPVAYLQLDSMPNWEFAAGTLFGVSDAVSDVAYKFDINAAF